MSLPQGVDPAIFTDVMYAAKTAWAEARGEGEEAMRWVVWVIRNRRDDPLGRWPRTVPQVVTQRHRTASGQVIWQFSCWRPGDPNREKMLDPFGQPPADRQAWWQAVQVAWEVLQAPPEANPIPGVFHFTSAGVQPTWARPMETLMPQGAARLVFYRDPAPAPGTAGPAGPGPVSPGRPGCRTCGQQRTVA